MTSRTLTEVFDHCRREKRAALVAFLAAGDPNPDVTTALGKAVIHAGADILELGIPFSDPLADGPVIQRSTHVALEGGMTVSGVLSLIKEAQLAVPVIAFGYLNPVLAYGLERFIDDAVEF